MATGIGETLREARQQQGLTLQDASAETRIRATHLERLENEEFTGLGGDVYVRGFIKSYARWLGLDPGPLLEAYGGVPTRTSPTLPPEPASLPAEPLERGPRRGTTVLVASLALLVLIIMLVWNGDDSAELAEDDDDPVAEEAEDLAEGEEGAGGGQAPATASPTPTPTAAEPEGLRVRLVVTDRETWVRALVDGEEVLQGLLEPGTSETFEAEDEVRLRLGDPGPVELTVNGEDQGTIGEAGQPLWITIDADGEVATS